MIDSQTGLPLDGVRVRARRCHRLAGQRRRWSTPTGPDGLYELDGVTEGTYGKLAVRPAAGGYDPVNATKVVVRGGDDDDARTSRSTATGPRCPAARARCRPTTTRSTRSAAGRTRSSTTPTTASGWVANNPTSPDYPGGLSGDAPESTFALPATVDVSAIGIDPAPGCGFLGASAGVRDYKLEVSSDGDHVPDATRRARSRPTRPARSNPARADRHRAARTSSTIRLTLIQSQNQGDGLHGSRLHQRLAARGVRRRAERASERDADGERRPRSPPGVAVDFDASSFTDPDSLITGYDWDFDGNGTVDRHTDAPTTSFAYGARRHLRPEGRGEGLPRRRGQRVDHGDGRRAVGRRRRGGGTTPPSALPKITIAKSGTKGSFTIRVTCAEPCKLSGKLTISKAVAKTLHRKKLTIGTVKRTITSTARRPST